MAKYQYYISILILSIIALITCVRAVNTAADIIKCELDTYQYRLDLKEEGLEKKDPSYVHKYHLDRLIFCLKSFASELEDGIELSSNLPNNGRKFSLIELIKSIYFLIGGSKTWEKIGNNQESLTHELALERLMKSLGHQQVPKKQEKFIEKLDNSFGEISQEKLVKGIEPLMIYLLNVVSNQSYAYINQNMAQTIMDLVADIRDCNNLFEQTKVHWAVMSLCLLDNRAKSVQEAQEDEIAKNYMITSSLDDVEEKYKTREGNLHEKWLDDLNKLRVAFFGKLGESAVKSMLPQDTLWFLNRIQDSIELNKEIIEHNKLLKKMVTDVRDLLNANDFRDDKCNIENFPFYSTKGFDFKYSVTPYISWCKQEQLNRCLKIFEDQFEEAGKKLPTEHRRCLFRAKEELFKGENSPNRRSLYEFIVPYKLANSLFSFMKEYLGEKTVLSYAKSSKQFDQVTREILYRVCINELSPVKEVYKQMMVLMKGRESTWNPSPIEEVSELLSEKTLELIAYVSICKNYYEKPNMYVEMVVKEFEEKYVDSLMNRRINKISEKCRILGTCFGPKQQVK